MPKQAKQKQGFLKRIMRKIRPKQKTVAVIRLSGVIGKAGQYSKGLSAADLDYLEKIDKIKNLQAVALIINSPGGSPVQSELIVKRVRSLSKNKKTDIPIYSFCEDVAASGGYFLSLAGDEIYALESSIIGSIGVISAGFGFTGAIQKLGIERRVYTQGKNKSVLDPFQEEKSADIELIKTIQQDVHESFINFVKERRGKRLKGKDDELFNGKFWSGKQAVKLGLIDGIADYQEFMQEKYGEKIKFTNIAAKTSFLGKLKTKSLNQYNFLAELKEYVAELVIWNRYGL